VGVGVGFVGRRYGLIKVQGSIFLHDVIIEPNKYFYINHW
jgi:hypothetical protein